MHPTNHTIILIYIFRYNVHKAYTLYTLVAVYDLHGNVFYPYDNIVTVSYLQLILHIIIILTYPTAYVYI